MSLISYFVPVYNNEGSIEATWEGIRSLFSGALSEHDYELIFINDGSRDASFSEMQEVAKRDDRVRLIDFTRNFGQLAAIIAGYQHALGDAVINMSADLQDPVDLTIEMVNRWERGGEVVVAFRSNREDSFGAKTFSRLAYGALRLSNPNIPKGGFDFVLMGRAALNAFLSYRGRNRFFQGDVIWAGFKTEYIPYVRRRREVGKSQYTFTKKLKLFYDFVLDGSYLPIRLMSLCGALCGTLGLIYAAIIVASRLLHSTPFQGWAPIMVAILVIGGAIMFMLGIIGEYLWRILDEIKSKPLYIVHRTVNLPGLPAFDEEGH